MHSRIFALRIVGKNIPTAYEMIKEEKVNFDLFSSFADYIGNTYSVEEDLKWLTTCFKGLFGIERKGNDIFIHLRKDNLDNYLEERYEKLQKAFEQVDFTEFTNSYSTKIWNIKELLFGDDYGFHFGVMSDYDNFAEISYDNELEFFRLARWLMVSKNLEEIVYRFEGSLDYHN